MNILMIVLFAVANLLDGRVVPSPPPVPFVPFVKVWADEFNGPAGTAPNPNRWKVETVDLGDTEQQSYVDDRRTSAHDGLGHMVLTAIKEISASGRPYISGRLSNGFSVSPSFTTYGRLQARMLIPSGQGVWPAFWTLGDWNTYPSWPGVGEIDVMEALNAGEVTHGGVHTVAAADGTTRKDLGGQSPVHPSGSYANGWHVWSIAWSPSKIVWYIDAVPWQTVTRGQAEAAGATWLFDGARPQAPILNLAVGGWAGPAAGWTSKQFLIDYVRFYSR